MKNPQSDSVFLQHVTDCKNHHIDFDNAKIIYPYSDYLSADISESYLIQTNKESLNRYSLLDLSYYLKKQSS